MSTQEALRLVVEQSQEQDDGVKNGVENGGNFCDRLSLCSDGTLTLISCGSTRDAQGNPA